MPEPENPKPVRCCIFLTQKKENKAKVWIKARLRLVSVMFKIQLKGSSLPMRSNFPPALYASYEVKKLSAKQHDELLANGWFRNDVNVFTSSIKFMGDAWRSCIMLRVPLENFTWKKRLRRLHRKNSGLFNVVIRPFQHTPEKEELWQGFKREVHGWVLIPQLDKHLLKNASPVHFNTWELCVYKDSKLVAFSVFDQGEHSISSLEAAYDTNFQRYSLGIYTMLMEIEYGIRNGMTYYYPGFFPRGVPMFDYKLRPGQVEFFRLSEKRWVPLEQIRESDWLKEVILSKYQAAKEILDIPDYEVSTGFGMYSAIPSDKPSATDFNLLLVVKRTDHRMGKPACLIGWDPISENFKVFTGNPLAGMAFWQTRPDDNMVRLLHVNPSRFVDKTPDLDALPKLVNKAIG